MPPKTLPELFAMAQRLTDAGYDPVLIKPKGCALKARPHVCANCGEREVEQGG